MSDRIYRTCLLSIAMVASTGCYSVMKDTARETATLIDEGDIEGAERVYGVTMSSPVSQREYDKLLVARCKLRHDLLRRELEGIRGPTFEEIDRLHGYARRCPDFAELDNTITNLGIAEAEKSQAKLVAPLAASGDIYGALAAAQESTPYLPIEHPRVAWINEQRTALSTRYAEGHRQHAPSHPLAASTFARLHNNTGATPTLPDNLERLAAQQVVLSVYGNPAGEIASDCASFVESTPAFAPGEGTTPVEVTVVKVSNCRTGLLIEAGVENYEVPVETVQRVQRKIATKTPVTSTQTTVERTCYQSDQGFGYGCVTTGSTTKSSTSTKTSYETVWEDEVVTVMEPRSRPVKYARHYASATVGVYVTAAGGQSDTSTNIMSDGSQRMFSADTTEQQIRAQMGAGNMQGALTGVVQSATLAAAEAMGRHLRVLELGRTFEEARLAGDTARAVELALVPWALGMPLTSWQGSVLESAFELPMSLFEPASLPTIGFFEWLDPVVEGNIFEQDPSESDHHALVLRGYPAHLITFGGAHEQPESGLVAQPARHAMNIAIDGTHRASLMSGDFHQGFGLTLGADWGVAFGKRLGDDYEQVIPPPVYVPKEELEERKMTLGFQIAGVAALGFRSHIVALAGGLKASYRTVGIGHLVSSGVTTPFLGRLELRFVERYPIVVEGWWGNLLANENFSQGGTLSLPMPGGRGLSSVRVYGRFEQNSLPARIPGLHANDPVFVESLRTTSAAGGIGFGF